MLAESMAVNLRKFALYLKKTASYYIQLESYKRQLASYLNSIDYTLPFAALDIDKRGQISQKNLQNFLIQHKFFPKPIDIDRYYQKYVHGKSSLCYQDILQALIPHSHYILMSSTTQKLSSTLLSPQTSLYLCKRSQSEIVKHMVALIVNTEIEYLSKGHSMIDGIVGQSLRTGALLWRALDRRHDNCVDYERMRELCGEFGVKIEEREWGAFVNWHFRSHKKYLTRADFMAIFDTLMVNKRNGSDCNLEQFTQNQIMKRSGQLQRQKQGKVEQIVKSRIENVSGELRRSASLQSTRKISKESEIIDPEADPNAKRLLYTKLGYKNPSNLIKLSQIN